MIGQTISHYKILEKLGEGGMGVVYKAEDTKLGRFVALKFLPPHLGQSEEEKKRFIHEAKAASALDHNNICTIYEVSESEDGRLFIAMACYEGESLKEKIERGPLQIEEAIDVTIQIAEGLTKAHSQDIVHRDMKPANVIVTNDGVAKIVDFGLAKLAGRTMLTKEGTTLGTVAYMSPEQTQGTGVDHRADIWALGVVLYEMITGRSPFKGDYEQAVMYSIMNEEPEPMTGLRTGIPLDLERIIAKALSKVPDERYQHASELLVDLKKIRKSFELEGTIPKPPLDSFKPRPIPKSVARRRAVIYATPSLLLLALIALFLWNKTAKQPGPPVVDPANKKIAVLPFVNLTADPEQEYFCDGMTEQVITNLSRIPELKVIARTSVMRYKNTQKDIRDISRELDAPFILEGSVRKSGSKLRVTAQMIQADEGVHLWANDYDRELKDIFAIQDDVSQSIAAALKVTFSEQAGEVVASSYPGNVEAYDHYLKARHYIENVYLKTKREADFQHALKLAQKAVALDPEFAVGYMGLGYLYENHWVVTGEQHDLELEEKYVRKAYELNSRLPVSNAGMGLQYLRKGELDKAFSFMKTALELNGSGWEAYHLFGLFCGFSGLYEQAVQYFSKAVELNPFYIYSISNRGWYRLLSGDFEGALHDYEKGYIIQPDLVPNLNGYALTLLLLQQYEQADEILTQAESLPPGAFGNTRTLTRALYHAISGEKEKALNTSKWGGVLAVLGMKEQAIDFIDNATRNAKGDNLLLSYVPLVHLPIYDSLRNEPRFLEIVNREKEKYEINLRKYSIPITD